MRTTRSRSPIRTLGLVATAAILASACSSATETTEESAPPGPAVVDVTTEDFAYVGLPASVEAGTTIRITNDSGSELHEFVAIRLPDDETRPVEELMQLPPEELAAFFPLVETVILASPGEAGIAVEGTGTLTKPGRYAIICAIPTGADPEEYLAAAAESEGGPPEVAGGPPHIVHGMFAELTVEG